MTSLLYLVTRACMALVALMAVDGLANTTLAADPWNIFSAGVLVVIADIIAYTNNE